MFNVRLKETKNDFGKSVYFLIDALTNEEKECTEEEFCELAVKGEIIGLETLKGGSVSQVLMSIMAYKEEEYTVTGRFEEDFNGTKVAGYEFEDTFKNKYILRVKEVIIFIKLYGSMVKNAKLNPSENYLISKNGSDLRQIRRIIVSPEKYLTDKELDDYYKICEGLRKLYEEGKLIF